MFDPLSPAQRRVWVLHQLDPTSPASNRPLAMRLTGSLDCNVIRRALDEIARRHESLRTTFPSENGEPWQSVQPPGPVAFEYSDLPGLPAEQREDEARRIAASRALETFDLERGPLLRAVLLRLGQQEHVLLLLMHHIVFDGWSENILSYELKVLYHALSRGQASPLPDLPIQYKEYARWQAGRLEQGALDEHIEYWRGQLADLPPRMALPVAQPAGSASRNHGGSCSLLIPPDLALELKLLSRRERVTLFMALLAAFQLLLARYSQQQDIVVGVPVAGRNRVEVEKLIGCFLNVVVFRGRFSGEPTVRELLARSRRTALEAYAHLEVPFEKLVQELAPVRSPEQGPFFQVMFQLRNMPAADPVEVGDLRVDPFAFETGVIGGLDLSLEIKEVDRSLHCRLSFSLACFDKAFAERMLKHYRNLLQAFVRRPDDSIWTLPMLSEREQRQLLVEWNDTRTDWPGDPCAHHFFEQQAQRTPDAVAIVSENSVLSYRELNRRANRLARRLIALGARPEKLVAVCIERSPEMVIALLGILKAGAAYLPLDPNHPKERRASMLADAQPVALITKEDLASEVAAALPEQDDENPSTGVTAENLAYVIYTSGSTGIPKGVMVRHRSLCNYLQYRQRSTPLTDRDVHLQRSALTFDDVVWEYLLPLMVGARVVQARPGGEADGAYLVDLVARRKVTLAVMVPSQLAMFLAEPGVTRCTSLRRVVSGGEVLPLPVVQRFFELLNAELYNGYGPAETTVASTFYQCRPGDSVCSVPIGRPIANTEIYILDGRLQPVPVGVQGEIYIGGMGLARGYLKRPALTDEKFIPHPFRRLPGARVYRTGDLARYRPDGNIDFLGRADHQVKIRGARIELGEIEAVLVQHPAVQYAAVIVWEPAPEEMTLAAYVVAVGGAAVQASDLRTYLSQKLPSYMVPADWVFLHAIPFTSSGKIDRRALPKPDRDAPGAGIAVTPRNKLEAQLKSIWEDLLGARNIGLDEGFFELGGHSLLAVKLLHRIERQTGVRLLLSALLEAPTIEQLARLIEAGGHDSQWASLVPLRKDGARLPLFCMHGNDGNVLFYRELAAGLGAGQPVYGLQSPLLKGSDAGLRTLEQLAALYAEEIRSLQPHGPYCLAGFCMGAYLAFEVACRLQHEGEEVGLLAVINTGGSWRLAESFSAGIRYHLGHLAKLSFLDRVRYLVDRARYRGARGADLLAGTLAKIYSANGAKPPDWVRRRCITAAHIRASAGYVPGVFRGKLRYFQGREETWRDFRTFWGRAVDGRIDCVVVPGRGIGVLREPNVTALAAELRACLDKIHVQA